METASSDVIRLHREDLRRAAGVLQDAFRDDPIWTRMFENEPDAERKKAAFFETPLRYARRYGDAAGTSEALEGVAAFLPGEFADMTVWRMLRSGALWTGMRMGLAFGKKVETVFEPMQADRREHTKGRRYLYLQIIGVAHAFQGRGFGGRLLRALLGKADGLGLPVYLETETEGNVALYERFGFRVLDQIELPVIGVPLWEMIREAGAGREG